MNLDSDEIRFARFTKNHLEIGADVKKYSDQLDHLCEQNRKLEQAVCLNAKSLRDASERAREVLKRAGQMRNVESIYEIVSKDK